MDAVSIELTLLPEQYDQLEAFASAHKLSVAEAAQAAVTDWLDRQGRLERAHALMRELGQGLGQGAAPHDAARRHDAYLYSGNDE